MIIENTSGSEQDWPTCPSVSQMFLSKAAANKYIMNLWNGERKQKHLKCRLYNDDEGHLKLKLFDEYENYCKYHAQSGSKWNKYHAISKSKWKRVESDDHPQSGVSDYENWSETDDEEEENANE